MGLAASQVRLLSISSQRNNIELVAQKLSTKQAQNTQTEIPNQSKNKDTENRINDSSDISAEALNKFFEEMQDSKPNTDTEDKYDKDENQNNKNSIDTEYPQKDKNYGKDENQNNKNSIDTEDKYDKDEKQMNKLKSSLSKLAAKKAY